MHDKQNHEDHTADTHSKQCDAEGCTYVAKTHAHEDDEAAMALAHNLAEHNKEAHQMETSPEEIKEEVKAKMTRHGH